MLTGRKTHLKFDDYTSDSIAITNGTTQGCPLSMLFYAFYNAPLIEVAHHKHESSLGFVDDSMMLAIADSLTQAHNTVKAMMERPNRGFDWSTSHNFLFELSKLALMHFPCTPHNTIPPDLSLSRRNLDGSTTLQTVKTVATYKYLGVVFDSKLCWTAHLQKSLPAPRGGPAKSRAFPRSQEACLPTVSDNFTTLSQSPPSSM